jgi:hypothetical protein
MFGPSLKSVPGCLVSIVPMLIGVPVAFTPGFGPHEEVSVDDPPPLPVPVPALVALPLELVAPPPPPAELLLLLPQPASAMSATTASNAKPNRTRGTA